MAVLVVSNETEMVKQERITISSIEVSVVRLVCCVDGGVGSYVGIYVIAGLIIVGHATVIGLFSLTD